MKEKKFSESVAHVMEYIKFSEMGGEIDETDPYYPMYLGLRDLLFKVKDEEEILDEDTQTILSPQHIDRKDDNRWHGKEYDTQLDGDLYD